MGVVRKWSLLQGRYGLSTTSGLTDATCSGVCDAGRYAAGNGSAVTSQCEGPATAGYYTNAGANSSTQNPCPIGKYSLTGAPNCTLCPTGQYQPSLAKTNCTLCAAGMLGVKR